MDYMRQEDLRVVFVGDKLADSCITDSQLAASFARRHFWQTGQLTIEAIVRLQALTQKPLKIQPDFAAGKR
jgi:hypothetical protein